MAVSISLTKELETKIKTIQEFFFKTNLIKISRSDAVRLSILSKYNEIMSITNDYE